MHRCTAAGTAPRPSAWPSAASRCCRRATGGRDVAACLCCRRQAGRCLTTWAHMRLCTADACSHRSLLQWAGAKLVNQARLAVGLAALPAHKGHSRSSQQVASQQDGVVGGMPRRPSSHRLLTVRLEGSGLLGGAGAGQVRVQRYQHAHAGDSQLHAGYASTAQAPLGPRSPQTLSPDLLPTPHPIPCPFAASSCWRQ